MIVNNNFIVFNVVLHTFKTMIFVVSCVRFLKPICWTLDIILQSSFLSMRVFVPEDSYPLKNSARMQVSSNLRGTYIYMTGL